jgi:hypothetical protein
VQEGGCAEDGRSHRHGHSGARAHGEEERVLGVCKLCAVGRLHLGHRSQDVVPHPVWQLAASLVEFLHVQTEQENQQSNYGCVASAEEAREVYGADKGHARHTWHTFVVIVKPGGTRSPSRAISQRLAPLPPSSCFISLPPALSPFLKT